MKTTFQIHNMTTGRSFLGERETFAEAEAFGRWHAARHGWRIKIDQVIETPKRRVTEEVATIMRDAHGNSGRGSIWTDLTWHGAELV